MNRDDIIRLAREAGFTDASFCRLSAYTDDLERFAALIAAAEREALLNDGWRQCAVGQRMTQFCSMTDAAVKAEREACAKIADEIDDMTGREIAANIRARGEK